MKVNGIFRKAFAILMVVVLAVSLLPTSALAAPGGNSGSSGNSVGHIDLGISLVADITIDGVLYQDQKYTLTKADLTEEALSISAEIPGSTSQVNFSYNLRNVTADYGTSGMQQLRIPGTFPVGTKNAPVIYTVSLTKNITVRTANGPVSIAATFTSSFGYWDSDNDCPGIRNSSNNIRRWQSGSVISSSGLDFVLGHASGTVATSGVLNVQKTITGLELAEGQTKTFNFDIYKADGSLYDTVSATVSSSNPIALISATRVPFGTYYVVERDASVPGYELTVSYDGLTAARSGNVVLNKDNAAPTVSVVNAYTRGFAEDRVSYPTLDVLKIRNDSNAPVAGVAFTLYADANCANAIGTYTTDADGVAEIAFQASHVAGAADSKVLYLKETNAPSYLIQDDQVYTLTLTKGDVTVEAPGGSHPNLYQRVYSWELAVTPDANLSGSTLTVVNTYTSSNVPTSVTLQGTKTLTGRDMAEGEFSFVLMEGDDVISTTSNTSGGAFAFAPITFTEEGIYNYTVFEAIGQAGGVSYDETVYQVTITVTGEDDGLGSNVLSASVSYNGANALAFANTYTTKTQATDYILTATKALAGRDMAEGEFSFLAVDAEGQTVATGTNDADGNVIFSTIGFEAAGTYTYTVKEVAGTLGGVTYDETVYTVTIVVIGTDDGNGNYILSVDSVSYGNADALTFANTYETVTNPTSVTFTGRKALTGKTLTAGMFSFEAVDQLGNVAATGTNDANGAITFTDIEYSQAGTYIYTIREVDGGLGGITYDTTTFTATVTVTGEDDGNGNYDLSASVSYDAAVSFENIYSTENVETAVTISGLKALTGRDLNEGEFSFQLIDADGAVLETVANAADGAITFAPITYTEEGIYTYTVAEVQGTLGGITYDETVYEIIVTVTGEDDGNGNNILHADLDTADAIAFNNIYSAENVPVAVTLEGHKFLSGRELNEGEFSFQLMDANDEILETVSNAADGSFTFQELLFEEAGVYHFTIVEAAGQLEGVTYDDTVYSITVTVTGEDDLEGFNHLSAEVSYGVRGNKAVFHNTYTEVIIEEPPVTEPPATEPPATEPPATEPPATEPPATEPPATEPPATEPPATEPPADDTIIIEDEEVPLSSTPKTGDLSFLWVASALVSGTGMIGLITKKRKEENEQ